jgi:sulfur carrier protein
VNIATDSVSVNGKTHRFEPGTTVEDIVRRLTPTGEGCAVAINDAVVPRSDWSSRVLAAGDRVEVLTAAQGG